MVSEGGDRGQRGSRPAVRFVGLAKRFGGRVVLRGVRGEMGKGVLHWIGGPNGAGKTTLLRLIAGEIRPTVGSVDVFVEGVGLVSQASRLYGELTAERNVVLAAEMAGVEDVRGSVGRVKDLLGGGAFWGREVRVLSTGQVRRVALARVLVGEPELLLLDEPWSGLDKDGAGRLRMVVQQVVRAGGTVVVVSHRGVGEWEVGVKSWWLSGGRLQEVSRETSGGPRNV